MDERRLYLAYGSNLGDQMLYCCPAAVFKGTTRIENYRLVFRSKGHDAGVATIEPYPESFVSVAIWEITPTHEQMLDRYEGVDSGSIIRKTLR